MIDPLSLTTIPRLFTAMAEWCGCLVYISAYPLRMSKTRFAAMAACALAVQCLFLQLTGDWPTPLWLPVMAAAVVLMHLFIRLCIARPFPEAGYCTVRAFLLAELAASLEWQLYSYVAGSMDNHSLWLFHLVPAAVYLLIFPAAALLEQREGPLPGLTGRELAMTAVMAAAVFAVSNLSFVYTNTPFSSSLTRDIYNIRTLVDLAGVILLYAYHLQRRELQARQEVTAIQAILEAQYAQYRQSTESIDLINRKYHDLKHQITLLRAEPDAARRTAFLDEMEREIRSYEAQNKTGNSVLDTILTAKSLYCAEHDITMTVVADGRQLDFISAMDLSSLFGNALDNAIECEESIPAPEHRMIHLEVFTRNRFLFIQVENICEQQLTFRDGLPVSTKGDEAYHGFGVKSIRYTARKYDGSVTVRQENGWFVLRVVIPLPGPDTKPQAYNGPDRG